MGQGLSTKSFYDTINANNERAKNQPIINNTNKQAQSVTTGAGSPESTSTAQVGVKQPFTTMPTIEGLVNLDIMDGENIILDKLKVFNKAYFDYIQCNNATPDTCTTLQSSLKTANDNLIIAINSEKQKLTTAQGTTGYLYPNLSQSDYDTKMSGLLRTNDDIIKMRNDIDMKLKELNYTEDSISNNYKKDFDSIIYAKILLSALTTSLVYYYFKEL